MPTRCLVFEQCREGPTAGRSCRGLDGASALPHLDEQGIRYYLPALMLLYLRQPTTAVNERGLSLALDSLQHTLQPAWPSTDLAAYQRHRFSLLTFEQRRAILRFVGHAASSGRLREVWPEVDGTRDAWLRAVRAGDDPHWSRSFQRT